MANSKFDPDKALGERMINMTRQELCELGAKLCALIRSQAGPKGYRGGIFPDNIGIDESGVVTIGSAKASDWSGQELDFIAPELYWHGQLGPASDVYSVGLVLYYAASGGKLPYQGQCKDPLLRRMGGENFAPPEAAGRRLGDIIARATSFKATDRYGSLEEMQAVLESCVKNLYLKGKPSAVSVFNKSDDDLNELERMMVGIIEHSDEELSKRPKDIPVSEPEPLEEDDENDSAAPEGESEPSADAPDKTSSSDEFKLDISEPVVPESKRQPDNFTVSLFEEKFPALEPVVLDSKSVKTPAVQYSRNIERERKIAEEVKKRKNRPVAIILALCAALVMIAIVFNAMLKDMAETAASRSEAGDIIMPSATLLPSAPVSVEPTATPAPTETPVAKESSYQIIVEDISWTQAQARCTELGGHLAVISSGAEFEKVTELAGAMNVTMLWVGCHRIDGTLVWETTDEVTFQRWAPGEPSLTDGYDGVSEDYIMLWKINNDWYYNDSRDDPAADYPEVYSGKMGFVCEIER